MESVGVRNQENGWWRCRRDHPNFDLEKSFSPLHMAEVGAALGLLTAAAASFKDVDWDLVSSYVGLLSLATFCVYTGAYGSLPVRICFTLSEDKNLWVLNCGVINASRNGRRIPNPSPTAPQGLKVMTMRAKSYLNTCHLKMRGFFLWCVPLICLSKLPKFSLQVGSVLLGGFYLIVVYLGDYWINIFLRGYLSVAGIGSVWNVSRRRFLTAYVPDSWRWNLMLMSKTRFTHSRLST
jgi:hypothetical protein